MDRANFEIMLEAIEIKDDK